MTDSTGCRIAIVTSGKAYLPEATAYHQHFSSHGFCSSVIPAGEYNPDCFDVVVLFNGFNPFWKKYSPIVVEEYHSLSTGQLRVAKDLLKRVLNKQGNLRIFLNEEVRARMFFRKNPEYLYRPMGVFPTPSIKPLKKFDIVYLGSRRRGLEPAIKKLASMGFSILLVGDLFDLTDETIHCSGMVRPEEVGEALLQARFGLNFQPTVLPFSIQDSTKLLEYCSAGLDILSSRGQWTESFERSRNAKFQFLDQVKRRQDILDFQYSTPDVSDLEWSRVLERVGLGVSLENLWLRSTTAGSLGPRE